MDIKSPGLSDDVEEATLTHSYPQDRAIDGYEKLYDALNGDQSHFVHADEVMNLGVLLMIYVWVINVDSHSTYIYTGGWGPTHKMHHLGINWDYPA